MLGCALGTSPSIKVLGYKPEGDSKVKFAKDIQGFLVGDGATGGLGRVGR